MNGKVTIESGNYKTIINIEQEETGDYEGRQTIHIDFEPELDLKINSPEINFVANMTEMFIHILKG